MLLSMFLFVLFLFFFLGVHIPFRGISCSQGNPLTRAFNDSTGSYTPKALRSSPVLSKKELIRACLEELNVPLKSSRSCDNQLSLQLS